MVRGERCVGRVVAHVGERPHGRREVRRYGRLSVLRSFPLLHADERADGRVDDVGGRHVGGLGDAEPAPGE
jgi:hypothetical protein